MLPRKNAALGRNGTNQAAGKDRRRGHLVIENVRARLGNHFLAGLREGANRNLVAHSARRHKQRRLAAKDLRRAPLEQIDGRVLAVNVVANFSRGHRRAHLRRRLGYSVRTQINNRWQSLAPLRLLVPLVPRFLGPCFYGICFIGSSITGVRLPSFSA